MKHVNIHTASGNPHASCPFADECPIAWGLCPAVRDNLEQPPCATCPYADICPFARGICPAVIEGLKERQNHEEQSNP